MSESSGDRDPVELLAEEFIARKRGGERPTLSEYTERHPELAREIRDLFPALLMMEDLGDGSADSTGPHRGTVPALEQLGDYRILREVGRGAMGVVYEAQHRLLGRRVALKVLPPHALNNTRQVLRFEREARAAARLHHTNIVPVYDVGYDDGMHYYVMQFIPGLALDCVLDDMRALRDSKENKPPAAASEAPRSTRPAVRQVAMSLATGSFCGKDMPSPIALADEASTVGVSAPALNAEGSTRSECGADGSRQSLPESADLSGVAGSDTRYWRSVARVGCQVANALAHAHLQGIFHRDIKPSNLLMDLKGTVWVTDFGLAKCNEEEALTQPGDIVGTIRYMAPERFQGHSDARSDVYSLGVTLYELLVLQPAFGERDRAKVIQQVMNQEPPPLRQINRAVPRDLETIVQKAIAKEPCRRYRGAAELAADLQRFLEDRPPRARRVRAPEHFWRWCRRNPIVASLVAAVFLLLVCLTAGSILWGIWSNQDRYALEQAEKDGTEQLYQSLVAQAKASHLSRQMGQRFNTLDAVRKAAKLVHERQMPAERLDDLRNLAVAALALPDFKPGRTWDGLPAGSPAWDVDDQGRLYARTTHDGFISLRRIDTDDEIARLEGWKAELWIQFSPGGRYLLAHGGNHFRIWGIAGDKPRLIQQGEERGIAIHPDGRHLLVSQADNSLWMHDLDAQQPEHLLKRMQIPIEGFSFNSTGDRVAIISSRKVHLLDSKTGDIVSSIPESAPTEGVAWHPGGNYLALVCTPHEIHVWDLRKTQQISVLKGCRSSGIITSFTPDGELLISTGWEGVVRVWNWRTGRETLRHPADSYLRFCKDGRLPIRNGTQLGLLEIGTGQEHRSLVVHTNSAKEPDAFWGARIYPDGRLCVVAMSDHAGLFDLETAEEVASLPAFRTMALAGDGALFTNGQNGLQRWPLHADTKDPCRMKIGPPDYVFLGNGQGIDCDNKGEVIGQPMGTGAVLVRPGKELQLLGPLLSGENITISSDGRYAATGNHHGNEGLKVWDTETGKMLIRFETGGFASGMFSPDGKCLVVGGPKGCQAFRVGTWEKGPAIDTAGYGAAFSPVGSLFAAGTQQGFIRMLDPTCRRELVRFEDPYQDRPGSLTFTPDGSKLVNSSDDGKAVHVWDLRLIRRQLAEMGLDWDAPPTADPPPSEVAAVKKPLIVEVDPPDYGRYKQTNALMLRAKKIEHLRELVRVDSENAQALNSLALLLVTGPAELRQPKEGLDYARKATALAPSRTDFRNTLSVALCCNKEFAEAITVLEAGLKPGNGANDLTQAKAHNSIAWLFVAGPVEIRQPQKGLDHARKAVALAPGQGMYQNTLGVALYRNKEFAAAVTVLERSLKLSNGATDGFDLFFLAMCHHRLGNAMQASECQQRAINWLREKRSTLTADWIAELTEFQREAEAELGPE